MKSDKPVAGGMGGFGGLMEQAGGLGGLMKAMGGSPMGLMSAFYGAPFFNRQMGGMVNPYEQVFMQQLRQGKMPQFQQPATMPPAGAQPAPAAPQVSPLQSAMSRFGGLPKVPGLL